MSYFLPGYSNLVGSYCQPIARRRYLMLAARRPCRFCAALSAIVVCFGCEGFVLSKREPRWGYALRAGGVEPDARMRCGEVVEVGRLSSFYEFCPRRWTGLAVG